MELAIDEILAKTAGQDFGPKIAVGGRNKPHRQLPDFGEPRRWISRFLNHPQKLGLHGQRRFAHFIEKHRAAVSIFKQSPVAYPWLL